MDMPRILLAGATGLTGSAVLKLLAGAGAEVITIGRRQPAGSAHHITTDFSSLVPSAIPQVDVAISCLGTTIKNAGSEEAFFAVDYGYVRILADAAMLRGASAMILQSSVGANAESGAFYLRTKGQIERYLRTLPFYSLALMRPSLLLGERAEGRPGEQIGAALSPIVSPLMIGSLARYKSIPSATVAAAMAQWAMAPRPGTHIIEYRRMIELAEELYQHTPNTRI